MMLTRSYVRQSDDQADSWAVLREWVLRETRYRDQHPDEVPHMVSIYQLIPARDAGDVCHVCGEIVTWTDHLPPVDADGSVRCFAKEGFNAEQ